MPFSSLNRCRWVFTVLALFLLLPLSAGPAMADTEADIKALIRASKARAAIVKKVSPAVVNISVSKTIKHENQGGRGNPEDMPEFFNDEFFRRFFQPRLPREFKQRGMGSGSIIDKRGYVLTNNHVVGEADQILVKLPDGREFEAKLIGADPGSDVAIVQIKGDNLPVASLGDSDKLEVGESVIAIGNPFGLEQTITAGIVSAKGRSAVGVTDYEDFIQTDASINPGNSGGPLVNLMGEVIGVNTAIFSRTGGNQGIGFTIPINMARKIMDDLIRTGKVTRGFLGVAIQEINRELAEAMGLKKNGGVLISSVGKDTPADKGGIQEGDIILSFNERPMKSPNVLRNTVAGIKPGKTVPAEVMRNGKKMTLNITIEEQPEDMTAAIRGKSSDPESAPKAGKKTPESSLGLVLGPLTRENARQFGYQGLRGVLIMEVEPNSSADEAGLQKGALIQQVGRRKVHNLDSFRSALRRLRKGKNALLVIRMGEFTRYLAIKVP